MRVARAWKWIVPVAAFVVGGWLSFDNRTPPSEVTTRQVWPGTPQIDCYGESKFSMEFTDWQSLEQTADRGMIE